MDNLDKLPNYTQMLYLEKAKKIQLAMLFSMSFGRQPKDKEEEEKFIAIIKEDSKRRSMELKEQREITIRLIEIEKALMESAVKGAIELHDYIRERVMNE